VTRAIVVMGVSGCGKSTLAEGIAAALGWRFVEGDDLHPPANVAKMAAGIPLDDEDRAPFLDNVAAAIRAADGVVASCSALKRRYRDRLRAQAGELVFVLPMLDRADLLARMTQRANHFMPASLLDSQLAALELPGEDERAILVDGTATPEAQVAQALAAIA
jgi:carbohydrate kinase (thermoresistant glucokinase family)